MVEFNGYKSPSPCLRLDTGCGADYESVELGDGTGYIRLDLVEKWRDLVWKLYTTLGYAMQFGDFSNTDGAVISGVLVGCSGIIEELSQLQEIRFGQMQSAADMLKRRDETQATADMLERFNEKIVRQSLNGAGRGCPMCDDERRKESDNGRG